MPVQTPRDLGLPHDTWRTGQALAIKIALKGVRPHTIVQAPTGTGKSLIAGGVAIYDQRASQRDVILTGTKGLQDQYSHEQPMLTDVRGMSNYECLAAAGEFRNWFAVTRTRSVTCDRGPCRSGQTCSIKLNGCLYYDAVRAFLASPIGLTNYDWYFAQRRYGTGVGHVHRLMLDEAHDLPERLMSACAIELPLHTVPKGAQYQYPPDEKQGRRKVSPSKRIVDQAIDAWRVWAHTERSRHSPSLGDSEDSRYRKVRLLDALEHMERIDHTWAWDTTRDALVFEPTIPRNLFPLLVAPGERTKAVYLSATITPALLRLLGVPDDDVTFYSLKSRFPSRSRPVYVCGHTRVDHWMTKDEWVDVVGLCDDIITPRLDRRGLVHTKSFERAQNFVDTTRHRDKVVLHRRGESAARAVERYRAIRGPALLVSPSISTGFNFAYQDAEYQILLKMPFLDTRDNRTRVRLRATEGYGDHVVSQEVIQTCGRINRAEDDQGETFIVDGHARWLLGRYDNEGLLPESFTDALYYESPRQLPFPLPKLR